MALEPERQWELRTLCLLAGQPAAAAALPAFCRGAKDGDGAWAICFADKGRVCQTDIASVSLRLSEAGLQSPAEHRDFRPLANLAGLLRSVQVMVALLFPSASC